MELSKHRPHRNPTYLNWLRTHDCVVSGDKAQCAHHIRIGTNGGSSLKPSDYFCIPLTNQFHTTGSFALHIVGEDTFLKHFGLDQLELFAYFLAKFAQEKFGFKIESSNKQSIEKIAELIQFIEEQSPKDKKQSKRTPKKKSSAESEYELRAKDLKRQKDKETRQKIKVTKPVSTVKKSLKGTEFYEKAKEQKRIHDKQLRDQLKKTATKTKNPKSDREIEFYEKSKEANRQYNKEMRLKNKERSRKASK